jgi:drug/metabolite transporter (DMT)-like permease
MSATALMLVIAGALVHATWNMLAKQVAGGAPFVFLYGLVSLFITVPIAAISWTLNPTPIDNTLVLAAAASGALHLVYSLVLQRGYQVADFSVVYPVARGTGPLLTVFGAILLLGEMPSLPGWMGIAAVVSGVFIIAKGPRQLTASRPDVATGVLWGSLTGLFIASYTLVDGWAMKVLGASPLMFYAIGFGFRTLFLAPRAWHDRVALRARWRSDRGRIVLVGALVPLAYLMILFAMRIAPLSYVAPAREISMLLGAYIGARFFGEPDLRSRMVGASIMVAGVAALALA